MFQIDINMSIYIHDNQVKQTFKYQVTKLLNYIDLFQSKYFSYYFQCFFT